MMHTRLVDARRIDSAVKLPEYAHNFCYEVAVLPTIPRVRGNGLRCLDFPLRRAAPTWEETALGTDDPAAQHGNIAYSYREAPNDDRPSRGRGGRRIRLRRRCSSGRCLLRGGHAVGLETAGFCGGSGIDDHFGGCSVHSAEESPDRVAGAFEAEAPLGVGGHPVFADDAVASSPSARVGGVLAPLDADCLGD